MSLIPALPLSFEAALRDVRSKRPESRLRAVTALASPPPGAEARALEALRAVLDDPFGPLRHAALLAVGEMGDAESLDIVLARFDDGDREVRQAAVIAAGRIGDGRAAPHLRRALEDARPEMRFQAAMSFAELCPDEAFDAVRSLLDDDDAEVRANAVEALCALDDRRLVDVLSGCLDDGDPAVRRTSARALAERGDDRGADELLRALDDPHAAFEAATALGALGVDRAREPLFLLSIRLFVHLPVRAAAGGALVRLGDPRGEEVLRRVLRAWRADGRSHATALVGELGLVALLPEVLRLAERPRSVDPWVLARALGRLAGRSDEAARALERLADRSGEAGEAARDALSRIA